MLHSRAAPADLVTRSSLIVVSFHMMNSHIRQSETVKRSWHVQEIDMVFSYHCVSLSVHVWNFENQRAGCVQINDEWHRVQPRSTPCGPHPYKSNCSKEYTARNQEARDTRGLPQMQALVHVTTIMLNLYSQTPMSWLPISAVLPPFSNSRS